MTTMLGNLPKRIPIKKKTLVFLFVILGLVVFNMIYELPIDTIRNALEGFRANFGWEFVILGAFVYALLLSIPFFPGVELGWLIILLYGKDSVIVIYLFTLLGLILSFSFGRWIGLISKSYKEKIDRFGETYNDSLNNLAVKIHGVFSGSFCSLSFNRVLRNSQYLLLALLINIPGNSLVGGGGGIALLSGMNRSISFKGFLLTLVIAVSPLPILLYFGLVQVENLLM